MWRILRRAMRFAAAVMIGLLPASGVAAQSVPLSPWDISWLPPGHVIQDPIVREAAIRAINQAIDSLAFNNRLSLRNALKGRGTAFLSAAYEFGVDPAFVLSIMRFEDTTMGYNFGAISCPGGRPAYGAVSCGGRFLVFPDPDTGIRAVFWYLAQDPNVQPCRGDPDPVACVIRKYAPPPENPTEKYIRAVRGWTSSYRSTISSAIRAETRRYLRTKMMPSLQAAMRAARYSTPVQIDSYGGACYAGGDGMWCREPGGQFWYPGGLLEGWRWYPRMGKWCYGPTSWCLSPWW
jgi:hypothetical protein